MRLIAHRGAPRLDVENTVESFLRAIEMGADSIELDVRFSKSGKAYVFHDRYLKRMTSKRGWFHRLSEEELAHIKLHHETLMGRKIPELKEVLANVWGKTEINIEVKEWHAQGLSNLVTLLKQYAPRHGLLLSSFNEKIIHSIQSEMGSDLRVAVNTNRGKDFSVRRAQFYGYEAVHTNRLSFDARKTEELQNVGIKTRVFTVNDPKEYIHFKNMGVDAIFTDDIVSMKAVKQSLGEVKTVDECKQTS